MFVHVWFNYKFAGFRPRQTNEFGRVYLSAFASEPCEVSQYDLFEAPLFSRGCEQSFLSDTGMCLQGDKCRNNGALECI